MRIKTLLLLPYSSMNEWWLERLTRTCDLRVILCAWLVPTPLTSECWLTRTSRLLAISPMNVCPQIHVSLQIKCDGCMFLSFSLNIDSILRVCQMIKKFKFHLVYVFSFFINLLLSTSFLLQNCSRIPILGLSLKN